MTPPTSNPGPVVRCCRWHDPALRPLPEVVPCCEACPTPGRRVEDGGRRG